MQRYRLALYSAGIVMVVALCSSFASRAALGVVIDSCKLNYMLTSSAFPCQKVVESPERLQSYAILREPTHRERTILTPLDAVVGIEDARLLLPDAPNYFEDAWKERSIVMDAHPNKDPWTDAALAINPASNRTQDHLHIHIGCVSSRFKSLLTSNAGSIPTDRFDRMTTRLAWRSIWVKFVQADSLADINLFRLVADDVPGARADMGDVTIGVVGASPGKGQKGFYVLAQIIGEGFSYGSAEDLLDAKCRR